MRQASEYSRPEKNPRISLILAAASVTAGAYVGFCHGHDLPIETFDIAILATPIAAHGARNALHRGRLGFEIGGIVGMFLSHSFGDSPDGPRYGATLGACGGALACGALGTAIGAGKGSLEALVGYTAGYTVGVLTR